MILCFSLLFLRQENRLILSFSRELSEMKHISCERIEQNSQEMMDIYQRAKRQMAFVSVPSVTSDKAQITIFYNTGVILKIIKKSYLHLDD